MENKGIVVVVAVGSNFNERAFREMLINQIIETEILIEEKPIFSEIMFESIEEFEAKQQKIFKKVSYQEQQKDLRFLNKRRKK